MVEGEGSAITKVAKFEHVMAQGCTFHHGSSFGSVSDDALVWLTPLPDESDEKCGLFFPIEPDADMDDVVFVRIRSVEGPAPVEGIAIIESDVLESLVPLRDLLEIPSDLSSLPTEGLTSSTYPFPSADSGPDALSAQRHLHDWDREGFELAEAWLDGEFRVDETKAYLLRGLSVIPLELADNFVETWQVLEAGIFDAAIVRSVGAMCIALAQCLAGNE